MFVRNTTQWQVVLARGLVSSERSVLSLNLEVVLKLGARGVEALASLPRAASDAPDIRHRCTWEGVSVTGAGHALCPARPPYACGVSLRVGELEHRVVVLGPRVWSRALGGTLVATEPARFDALAVDWMAAFGGRHTVPPGLLEGTDLPCPGGEIAHPLNPDGLGWYPQERLAVGQPLPRVEDPAAPVRHWSDTPVPAGIAPCPTLIGLRLADWMSRATRHELPGHPATPFDSGTLAFARRTTLHGQHHAPGPLVLPAVSPGTPVSLVGLVGTPFTVCVPSSPVTVTVRRGRERVSLAGLLRALHVDADRGVVRLSYGHSHVHTTREAPHWVEVSQAKEGSFDHERVLLHH
ncbi:MAG: DUF2169 domain-containing protein [Myxococcales bacterium]|nr:DUF2169 domain-containing protein [Myxococcales bacterium]